MLVGNPLAIISKTQADHGVGHFAGYFQQDAIRMSDIEASTLSMNWCDSSSATSYCRRSL